MKKLLVVLIAVMLMFTLTACGNEEVRIEDNRTLEHFVQAFEDAGFEVRNAEPIGVGTGQVDNVMFEIMLEDIEAIIGISQFDNEEALARYYRNGGGTPNIATNGLFAMRSIFERDTARLRAEINEFFTAIE